MERYEHTITQLNMVESFVVKKLNILNEEDIKKLLTMKDQNTTLHRSLIIGCLLSILLLFGSIGINMLQELKIS